MYKLTNLPNNRHVSYIQTTNISIVACATNI